MVAKQYTARGAMLCNLIESNRRFRDTYRPHDGGSSKLVWNFGQFPRDARRDALQHSCYTQCRENAQSHSVESALVKHSYPVGVRFLFSHAFIVNVIGNNCCFFFISGSGRWWCDVTTPAFSYFSPHHFPPLPISLAPHNPSFCFTFVGLPSAGERELCGMNNTSGPASADILTFDLSDWFVAILNCTLSLVGSDSYGTDRIMNCYVSICSSVQVAARY